MTSVRSCQISEEQTEIARKLSERQDKIILLPTFGETHNIRLRAVQADQALQHGLLLVPSSVSPTPYEIREGGTIYGVGALDIDIRKLIEGRVTVAPDEVAVGELHIPVYLVSYYTVGGDPFLDISMYRLSAIYTVQPRSFVSSITFKDLAFLDRLNLLEGFEHQPDIEYLVEQLDSTFAPVLQSRTAGAQ